MASGTDRTSPSEVSDAAYFAKVRDSFDYTVWTDTGDVTWHMEIVEVDADTHIFKAVATSVDLTITKSLGLGKSDGY